MTKSIDSKQVHVERKFVFQNDATARYVFFAIKNDLGGLGSFRMKLWESVIISDTYFDKPDFYFSREGKINRYREERSGSEPIFIEEEKFRMDSKFLKKETEKMGMIPEFKMVGSEKLEPMAKIRTFRMVIAVFHSHEKPIGLIHCDQSTLIHPDDSSGKRFFEIELHYPDSQDYAVPMTAFSDLLVETFNLSPICRSKLERALDTQWNY